MVKPTPEEERNGWTEETLTKYLKDRDLAAASSIRNDFDPQTKRFARDRRPTVANGKYRPHRWRS